jgi:hypothetical protein
MMKRLDGRHHHGVDVAVAVVVLEASDNTH